MRYFTNELWSMMNSGDMNAFEEADRRWDANAKEYWSLYPQLHGRLSKKVFNQFKTKGFHDYRLVNIEIKHAERGVLNPVEVFLIVTNGLEKWKITFKKIKRLDMRFDSSEDETIQRRGFDDWGYNEILIVDDDTLSFEVLFASGATILIHFKNKQLLLNKGEI